MARGVSITLRLLTRDFSRRAKGVKSHLKGIRKAAKQVGSALAPHVGRAMDRIALAGTAAAGVGLGVVIRDWQDLEVRMTRVALTARRDASEIANLRKKLDDLASARTGQTAAELLTAVEELIALDVDWEDVLGSDLLEQLGKTATATGSDISDLARLAYTLGNAYKLNSDEIGVALEQLAAAGKRGAFLFKDMAAEMPQVAAVMAQIGQEGPEGLVHTAAMLQMVRRETADSATAANNLVNALAYIQGAEFGRKTKALGVDVDVFDEQGRMRDLFLILEDINRVTEQGANQKLMAQLFSDRQAREGMVALVRHGEDLHSLIETIQASGGIIDEDFVAVSETQSQQIKNLRAELERMGRVTLGPWVEQLGDFLKFLNDNPAMMDDLIRLGAAMTALSVGRKAVVGGMALFSGARAGGVTGAARSVAGAAAGQPVYVTNWHEAKGLLGAPVTPAGTPTAAPTKAASKVATTAATSTGLAGISAGSATGAALVIGSGLAAAALTVVYNEAWKRLTGGRIDPVKMWTNFGTTVAAWGGAEWAQRYKEDVRTSRERFREEKLRIQIEITDPDDRRAALKELRRKRRGARS